MTPKRPRVLFVSHSASRNGATLLLLSFLRWLRANVDWEIEFVVHGRGPLLDEFRALGKTWVWRDPGPALNAIVPRSMRKLHRCIAGVLARLTLPSGSYDLLYANTSASAPLIGFLIARAPSLVWHVHELRYALQLTLPSDNLLSLFRSAHRYIVVSSAVSDVLVVEHQVPSERIDIVNGFVAVGSYRGEQLQAPRLRLREDLQIPPDAFVVGACGSLGWRKGSDVFLQIARRVAATPGGDRIYFLWVGGNEADPDTLAFEHDRSLLGLMDRCRHVLTTANALDHYCAMDAFALTSREDPFPLVVLEAAEVGVPVVCFNDAGGTSEFVADGCGLSVPYLDIDAFAREIVRLQGDRDLAGQIGARGQLKVRERCSVESQGPKLLRSMQQCLPGTPRNDHLGVGSCTDHSACPPTGPEDAPATLGNGLR